MIQRSKTKKARIVSARIVFEGTTPKGFPADMVKPVRRRLAQREAAVMLQDLKSPPGNRLHRLTGERAGQWSISVNDPFRICFIWTENGPDDVEFIDYHWPCGSKLMAAYDFTDFVTPLPHPGAHLRAEFLPGHGLSKAAIAAREELAAIRPLVAA